MEAKNARKRWPDANFHSLREGYTLFVSQCGKCHEYNSPGAYSEDDWTDILHKMARKAHLKEGEEEKVRRYIFAKKKPENE